MKRLALYLVVAACGQDAINPSSPRPITAGHDLTIDTPPKNQRRLVPPEAFLRSYLVWFGGLSPSEAQTKAHGFNLFDDWSYYLAALGLPDYKIDVPRATQSNPMMIATIGRLGEALCVHAAEHDLHARKPSSRMVFDFDPTPHPTLAEFAVRLDILHRTFLSYPLELAPPDRARRFFALYNGVASNHEATPAQRLSSDELAWAAVCTALVQHPEADLY